MYRVIAGHPLVDAIERHQGNALPPVKEMSAGRYSEQLLDTIDRALSLDPGDRPQTAAEFLASLGVTIEPAPLPGT